ncbi:MAG: dTMP kinase [Fibrobacteria bacterium]|nr:dTMP kinase [Fibrobacteria bacterium]
MSGVLFSFEGIDGAGKTTQVALLSQALEERGHRVVCLREPGGTPLGEKIRGLLLDRTEDPPSPVAELLLFAAARAQIVATRIRPELEAGSVVILDRFTDATFAYQGYGRGLPLDQILSLEGIASGIEPRRTWYLDLDSEESNRRRTLRGEAPDRLESEGDTFRDRVRAGYLERARSRPARFHVVDASQSVASIATRILQEALSLL